MILSFPLGKGSRKLLTSLLSLWSKCNCDDQQAVLKKRISNTAAAQEKEKIGLRISKRSNFKLLGIAFISTQLKNTCSKSTTETVQKGAKYAQDDMNDVIPVFLLLNLKTFHNFF